MLEHEHLPRATTSLDFVGDVATEPCVLSWVGEHTAQRRGIIRRASGPIDRRFVPREGPPGDQHRVAIGAARGIGILVGPHVHAARTRPFDELDGRAAAPPVVRALGLDVRRHDADPALLTNLDRLADRIEQGGRPRAVLARPEPHGVLAFAAFMRDVDPVERRHFPGEGHHFVGRAPTTGSVFEAGRQAPCTLGHRLTDEGLHAFHLVGARGTPHVASHHLPAYAAVPDHQGGIGPDPQLRHATPLLGDRERGAPVLVHDHGRDALHHEVWGGAALGVGITKAAVGRGAIVGVRMDVDNPGDHDLAGGIDSLARRSIPQTTHGGNAPIAHGHVRWKRRIAGAVVHPPTRDHQVVRRRLCGDRACLNGQQEEDEISHDRQSAAESGRKSGPHLPPSGPWDYRGIMFRTFASWRRNTGDAWRPWR